MSVGSLCWPQQGSFWLIDDVNLYTGTDAR
jgi:hypothetical protein